MGSVVADISISLDGFVTGPHDGPGNGLGDGGAVVHNWVFGGPDNFAEERFEPVGVDKQVFDAMMENAGAAVVGRRMYDIVDGWGDDPPWHLPVFVVTHRGQRAETRSDTTFTFVTDGVGSAIEQALAAAEAKDVHIGGGAKVIQQALAGGLVDVLQLHIAPVVLGGGRSLFDGHPERLEVLRVQESPFATHVRYRVLR